MSNTESKTVATSKPSKVIENATGPVGIDQAVSALIETLGSFDDIMFTRYTVLNSVILANTTISRTATIKAVEAGVKARNNGRTSGLGAANLQRLALYADVHAARGVTATPGTVHALQDLYDLKGGPAALKAIQGAKSSKANTGESALLASVGKAIAASEKAGATTSGGSGAGAATKAPYTPAAFGQSVRDLLAKVAQKDRQKALDILSGIIAEGVTETIKPIRARA